MRKFIINQQQFKGRSFASVVAQRTQIKDKGKILTRIPHQTTSLVQQIPSNADVTQILRGLNEITNIINGIKEDLHKMDERIQYLKENAYYYHIDNNWDDKKQEENNTEDNTSQTGTQHGWSTPTT